MNKMRLLRFVQKYHLGGLVEAVKWTTKNNTINTKFISEDKSVLGDVTLDDFEFEDKELGLYMTSVLSKMLGVVGNDVDVSVGTRDGKDVSLRFNDGKTTVNYMLANLKVIPTVPEIKHLPKWDVAITFDQNFITTFDRAAGSLPEASTFTLLTGDDGKAQIVVGYSTINSNRISIGVDAKFDKVIDPISFRTDYLREILKNNKETSAGILNVSSEGLAFVEFEADGYTAKYYLVEVSGDD